MIFALLTLLAALGLAAVAGWFSIIGIMSIYAGAAFHALVMGVALEAGKLVTTSWLYRNWDYSDWKLKTPLIIFTLTLMLATSIGVFGFLSKAHLEQGAGTVDNTAKIERLDQQIAREKATIDDDQKVTQQLDATINSYLGKDRTDRSLSVRRSQAPQRKQLREDIDAAQKRIDGFSDDKLKLTSELRKQQLDVGPIRYIAELWYGTDGNADKNIESAVRIFTLIIVSSLDPLAVILLIAANHTLLRRQREKEEKDKEIVSPGEAELSGLRMAVYEQDGREEIQTAIHLPEEDTAEYGQPNLHDGIHEMEIKAVHEEVLLETGKVINEEENIPQETHREGEDGSSPELENTLQTEILSRAFENTENGYDDNNIQESTTPTISIELESTVHEINEEDRTPTQETGSSHSERSEDSGVAVSGFLYPKGKVEEVAEETEDLHLFPLGDDRQQEVLEVSKLNEEPPTFDELQEANAEGEGMVRRDLTLDKTEGEQPVNEEENPTLERLRSLLDVQAPVPFVRSPSPSRIEKTQTLSKEFFEAPTVEVEPWKKNELNTPWVANQSVLAELIGNRRHFIPQKINEETKFEVVEADSIREETSSPSEQIVQAGILEETDGETQAVQQETSNATPSDTSIPEENKITVSDGRGDKYPKALSWLNEFKRT